MVNPVFESELTPSPVSHTLPPARDCGVDGLVTGYRYLCARGARKFHRRGIERCDLEQVAAVGLIKAARRFDRASATPFEAYAWLTIVGELMHHVRDYERLVRVPRRLRTLEASFVRAQQSCANRLGREPLDAELAGEMGVLERTVGELRVAAASANVMALDEQVATSVWSGGGLEPEDRVILSDAFGLLGAVERRVLVGVYVLGIPQLELAHALGVSARRVSRIRSTALRTMQRAWAS